MRAGTSVLTRVARQAGWLLGANVVVFALAFGQNVVMARRLGPTGFGALALIFAITDVTQQLLSSRVWETATNFVPAFRSKGNYAAAAAVVKLCLLVDAGAALVATGALFVLAGPLAQVFVDGAGTADAIRLYSILPIILIPVATGRALLRLADLYRWLSGALVVEGAVRLVAVWTAVFVAGVTLERVVMAYLVAALTGTVLMSLMVAVAWRRLGLPPLPEVRFRSLSEPQKVIRFLLYSNLSGSFRLLSGKADVLLLGVFTDASAVGVYRLARTVADPLVSLTDPVYQATYPEMARLVHAGDGASVRQLAHGIRRRAWQLVVPVCLIVTLTAGWVIPMVFGAVYDDAAPLARILVWQLVWVPYLWVPGLLLSSGRADVVAVLTAADAVVYVALLVLLVPPFGAVGAVVATVARFATWAVAAAALGRRTERDLQVMPV